MEPLFAIPALYLAIGFVCACVVSIQIYRQFIPTREVISTFIAVLFLWLIFAVVLIFNWLFNGGRR